jgi:hypothetical protein
MHKNTHSRWAVIFALTILLSACSFAPAAPTATGVDPNVVFTAAAGTAAARGTQLALSSPSSAPNTPTGTATQNNQLATPTITLTLPTAGTTVPVPSQAVTVTPTFNSGSSSGDKAEFVLDVTIPDGANMKPGENFIKTWRLKNVGTTTWLTAYSMVRVSNDKIKGPATVSLSRNVPPGDTVDVSVDLTAPDATGTYTSYWKLSNDRGQLFGIGSTGTDAFYVQIKVNGGAAETPGTGTPEATSTPGSGDLLSGLKVSIDNADFTGTCPHEYTVTAVFTLSGPATVTYQLVGGSDKAGYTFNLPAAQTSAFPAGTQTLIFTLSIDSSMNGWLRLLITAPEEKQSRKAEFTLTCQ